MAALAQNKTIVMNMTMIIGAPRYAYQKGLIGESSVFLKRLSDDVPVFLEKGNITGMTNCMITRHFTKRINPNAMTTYCISSDFKKDGKSIPTQGWMGMRLLNVCQPEQLTAYVKNMSHGPVKTQIEDILAGNNDNVYVVDIGSGQVKIIAAGRHNDGDAKTIVDSKDLFELLHSNESTDLNDVVKIIYDYVVGVEPRAKDAEMIIYGTSKLRDMCPSVSYDQPLTMDRIHFEVISARKEAMAGYFAAGCAQRFSGILDEHNCVASGGSLEFGTKSIQGLLSDDLHTEIIEIKFGLTAAEDILKKIILEDFPEATFKQGEGRNTFIHLDSENFAKLQQNCWKYVEDMDQEFKRVEIKRTEI